MSPVARWGFVFVACPIRLEEERRLELVRLAVEAWFTDQREVRFDWPGCEGVVRVGSDVMSLGTFTGQLFIADVNVSGGVDSGGAGESGQIRFLVAEKHLQLRAGPGQAVGEA